jgi:hypothetical protein
MIAVLQSATSPFLLCIRAKRTCSRRVLPKVSSLVSSEESFGLDCWCGTSRKLFVEADYALHAGSILSSTDSLFPIRCVLLHVSSLGYRGLRRGSLGLQLGMLLEVENLQLVRPPVIQLADRSKVTPGAGRGHTLGGMRVESARRVTKLILITTGSRQTN